MPTIVTETYEERRARHIRNWLQDTARAQRVEDVCREWLESLRGNAEQIGRDAMAGLPLEGTLQYRLTQAGEPELAEAFEFAVNVVEGKPPELHDAINYALASAAGRLYARQGHLKAEWLGSFITSLYLTLWDDFADAAGSAMRESPEHLELHVQYLRSIVEQAVQDPSSVTKPDRTGQDINTFVTQFQDEGSFEAVWAEQNRTFLLPSSSEFDILRRADEQKFMQLVGSFPHPHLILQCLTARQLVTSTVALVNLLKLADSAANRDGHWRNAGASAVLLLKLITHELLMPHNSRWPEPVTVSHGDAETSEDLLLASEFQEYSNRVHMVVDAFMTRGDSGLLGHLWLAQVLRSPAPDERRSKRTKTVDRPFVLAHAIACRLLPMAEPLAWIREVGASERPYRCASVLAVAAAKRDSGAVRIAALATDIISESGQAMLAEPVLHDPAPVLRRLPGFAFAQIPSFASWYAQCWSGLRLERERAWRASRVGGWSNAAECMVVWGIGGLEAMMMETEPKLAEIQASWLAVERVVREGRLVEPRIGKDFWVMAICKLFAMWPRLFAHRQAAPEQTRSAARTHVDQLAKTISPYVGFNGDFMQVITSLRQAGVTPGELGAACQLLGRNLHGLIGRFLETRRRLSDPMVWNQKWVASMQQMQRQLPTKPMTRRDEAPPHAASETEHSGE
jgi:hypothetical protein